MSAEHSEPNVHDHHHEHTHIHAHAHDHERPPASSLGGATAALGYMIEHNAAHADELKVLAQKLREAGKAAEAETILEGVKNFDAGNARLGEALAKLREGEGSTK
jgi:hypothetical protein